MTDSINIYSEYVAPLRELLRDNTRRATVITFGCQQNEADSERIRGILSDVGYTITDTPDMADVIIVNTCAIREHAEDKALSMLGNFKAYKKKNSELIVGVVGCMSAEEHVVELIKTKFHYVTFTLAPASVDKIPEVIWRSITEGKRSFIFDDACPNIIEGIPESRINRHKAWVSIMYGCNNFCSYCIVPYTRGRERSRTPEAILAECRALIANGCHEITLLGQNVNSYKSTTDFAGLLESVANIPGDFLVRFMTSHPKDVSPRLIDVMAKYSDKIAPYFHLPLQSGSDKILKAMHRTYDRARFLSVVSALREKIPNISLSTDVIVGFPGESDEDFLGTMDILESVKFDIVYAFRFSPRSGTPAAKMADIVDAETVGERMDRLLAMQDAISLDKNLPYVGTVQRVLVDSVSKKAERGTYTARTNTNKLVHFTAKNAKIGEFCNVEIKEAGAFLLLAEEV